MKTILKILKIVSVTVMALILVLLILSAILEPQIARLFLQKANGSLNSRIEVDRINFSLLKSFPRASVEFKDLILFSPTGSDMSNQSEDTLLRADRLFVSLKIGGLIKKQYIIDRISLDKGMISIREDVDGNRNLDILKKVENSDTSMVNIELRNIRIDNTHISFISHSRIIETELDIINADSRLSLFPNRSTVDLNASIVINSFLKEDFRLMPIPGSIRVSTSITIEPDQIICEKASFDLLGSEIGLSFILNPTEKIIAADFNLSPTNVESVIKLFNKSGNGSSVVNNISGVVAATGTIEGRFSENNLPPVKASVNLERGALKIPGREAKITSISASGSLEVDPDDPARTFSVNLPSLSLIFNKSDLRGSLALTNINQPKVDLILTGNIESSELSSLLSSSNIEASGIVRTNLRLYGQMPAGEKLIASDLLKLNRSISLNLRSVTINFPSYDVKAEKIMGNIMISDNIWFDGISFTVDESILVMNGMARGFSEWLISARKPLTVSAGLWSNRLNTGLITGIAGKMKDSDNSPKKRDLIGNISLNLDLKLDSLIIKEFRSSMVSAEITYSNNFINIGSFYLNSLGGNFEGNAAIARLSTGKFVGKGWFDINGINIKETFTVFNNFGQQYITDKNLNGSFTGSLNITSEFYPGFKPDMNSLKLSGNYSITDGELINFEPVMKLSKFVELSELSDIHFSELQNNIIIENRLISIPSMEIFSSAFDLSLSGNHSFDGLYTYHLKLLLSDLLSRKAKENNSNISEFGIIEDDGLGKTSLFLRINGTKGGSKVSYDIKNLKVDIKKSVVEEKVNLKTILKEEYGWYAADSLAPKQKGETRKFRIIWEEADSIKTVEPPSQEKPLPLKNIFRKKRGGENIN